MAQPTQLNPTSRKVLEMITALQERHHLNQSAIPFLNKFILEIISSFAAELEVFSISILLVNELVNK